MKITCGLGRRQLALFLGMLVSAPILLTGCGTSSSDGAVATLGQPPNSEDSSATGTETTQAIGTPNSRSVGSYDASADSATTTSSSAARAYVTPVAAIGNKSGYKIGPQDVLDISVFKVPELSKTIQVSDSGTINLPLVGEIQATGRTAQDIERELTQKLGAKYLQSPQVTVFVKEFNSQRVTIDGAVAKPGVFPYRNSITLLQAVTMAGGLDKNSDSTVVVFRTVNGERKGARFDIGDIRDGQAPDPAIEPGDVVVVGTSAVKEAFNNVLRALPVAGLFMGL